MWLKSILPGSLAVIAAALVLAGCQSSSSSGSSSGTPASTPPTIAQVYQALIAVSNGINAADAGTSVAAPPLAPVGAPENGNAINFRVPETVNALSSRIRPDTLTCNQAGTDCTLTNKAGTVVVHLATADKFVTVTGTVAFTNYGDAATTYVVNGTLTGAEICTGTKCSSFIATVTGTLEFTGPTAFSMVWNIAESVTGGTTSCSGTFVVGGTTYTLSPNCSTVS